MAISAEFKRGLAVVAALRGVLMLLAGLYAVIWPASALTGLAAFGGALLMVDGGLGLWTLTFGGGKSDNYWFSVATDVLLLIVGVVILLSPMMAAALTVTFLSSLAGIMALAAGVLQISVALRKGAHYAHIWPVILSGASYVMIGLVFLLFPMASSSVIVVFGGLVLIMFSFGLLGWAWKLYQRSKTA